MIETKAFYDYLKTKNFNFFAGVPDSLLKDLCACIKDNTKKEQNIITANEGNAIALAAGYYLATEKYGIVYMQNSGIGNAVNPLLSLADEEVYQIPMLLIVGYRGEPNTKDEPQHVKQGKVTLDLFKAMQIETVILDENYQEKIDYCYDYLEKNSKPIALIVRKNTFTSYEIEKPKNEYTLTREQAINTILDNLTDKDIIVSTTGKTSRELFELREKKGQGHDNDFLTVGSMGHTSSIALGISLNTKKNVYCLDGDGSFLMHMGSFAIIPSVAKQNFKYILINNGAHESVGSQPTVAFDIDFEKLLTALGFKNVYIAKTTEEITYAIDKLKKGELQALIIYTKLGSRKDLGRPTISPIQNKQALMQKMKRG